MVFVLCEIEKKINIYIFFLPLNILAEIKIQSFDSVIIYKALSLDSSRPVVI